MTNSEVELFSGAPTRGHVPLITDFAVNVNIYVKDDTSVEGYFMKDVMIAPNSSFKGMLGGEKLIIPANNSLLIQSNLSDSCDAIISYVDIV